MEEWSEWEELGVLSLSCAVSFAFQYDWDGHETEYRLKGGSIVSGQVWADEEPFTYTDSDGDEVVDYDKHWNVEGPDGNPIDEQTVVAWRYRR
jgi:hypothetical protein